MMIISILIGSAVFFFASESDEKVEKLSRATQLLAKETMRDAKKEQRAYSLFISKEAIWVEPEMAREAELETRLNELEVDEGITISYKLNEENGWYTITSNSDPFIWSFTQTGLCEPLTLQFENQVAVDEISFHPLTAGQRLNEN